MRRIYYIIIGTISLIAITAYLYIFFSQPKTNNAKHEDIKSKSDIDLRPLIITKLQQLVKEGSNGLYNLSVEKIEPDILRSELIALNATLTPDSTALVKLNNAKKTPDNVFKISFDSLHITGITLEDFLHKDRLDLDSVFITKPTIETYYEPKPYNKAERAADDSATLYQRLMKRFKSISIHAIVVQHGTLINKDLSQKDNSQRFRDVSVHASNLLIDSGTQFDKNRFLFTKEAELSCTDIQTRTRDSMYFFKIGSIFVDAIKHTLAAKDISLIPRYSKDEFKKKVSFRKDYFVMKFPKVVMNNIDWWKLVNTQNLVASECDVYSAEIKDYIDRSLPDKSASANKFPGPLLMHVPLKMNVEKLNLHGMDVVYEEHNPATKKSSSVYFNNINGIIKNLTNLPLLIKTNKNVSFSGSGLFMHKIPFKFSFKSDLSKYKTGDFSTHIQLAKLDNAILNPLTEPLSLFTIKRGTMQKASIDIDGNNSTAHGKLVMLYNDLHITPLKPDDDGSFKKKSVMSFFANTFFIKNDNPAKGDAPRNTDVILKRNNRSFFGFIWKIILTGILKTIGVPPKYAGK
jgi:hypothetical protein